jgi:hypothetical protein
VAIVRVQGPAATVYALAVEPSCPTREVCRAMTLVVQSAVRKWQENKVILSIASGKGGTGKTLVATSLALLLGKQVQIPDLRWGEYIHTSISGTHLMVASPERIEKTASELKELGLQRLGVSHCTGFNASAALAKEFSDIFFLNNAGSQLTFE